MFLTSPSFSQKKTDNLWLWEREAGRKQRADFSIFLFFLQKGIFCVCAPPPQQWPAGLPDTMPNPIKCEPRLTLEMHGSAEVMCWTYFCSSFWLFQEMSFIKQDSWWSAVVTLQLWNAFFHRNHIFDVLFLWQTLQMSLDVFHFNNNRFLFLQLSKVHAEINLLFSRCLWESMLLETVFVYLQLQEVRLLGRTKSRKSNSLQLSWFCRLDMLILAYLIQMHKYS